MYASQDDNWNELFGKLGKLPPAEPKPFFYTRVKARLDNRQARPVSWLLNPAYAIAALSLLVLINVAVAVNHGSNDLTQTESTTYDGFVAEYHLLQFNWDANE
ncbi:hypothetical protein [Arsenicibacter rosenii]|uniref:Uncharacterized protein n=1 Tax=Arsenicibacter rosenii TaxID=1750698 RepID=A0A1S2VQN7_9BACT|nr:hypothetical protein [Arsenicibacter rosenii]OIN61081.1 hypothetical protein BLX24_03165 [Arsenicibacter rosenii]